MPQLDLYLWSNTLILFVSFFFIFYFFFVYYFLVGVAKIFFVRKKFYGHLQKQENTFKIKFNFIAFGLYFERFVFFVKQRNDLIQIFRTISLARIRLYRCVGFFFMLFFSEFLFDFFFELVFFYSFLMVRSFTVTDEVFYVTKSAFLIKG